MKIIPLREFQRNANLYLNEPVRLTKYNIVVAEVHPVTPEGEHAARFLPKKVLKEMEQEPPKDSYKEIKKSNFDLCEKHGGFKNSCGCE